MSSPRAVLLASLDTTEAGQFEYLLYGGLAAGLWGEPRYTEDVDFVLFVPERHAYRFLRVAAKHGFSVDEDLAIQQIQVSGWARLPFGGPLGAVSTRFRRRRSRGSARHGPACSARSPPLRDPRPRCAPRARSGASSRPRSPGPVALAPAEDEFRLEVGKKGRGTYLQ